jgi:glycosyltransferase involved in cell wall biosynthesis
MNLQDTDKTVQTERHVPKVSIGMPVYNGEKFIRKALDSLLAQTFTDFELIISDNASTDKTKIICEEYAKRDERIRYICQSQNIGAINNFLFVLNEACGKYFMWASHDDYWDNNWLELLLTNIKDNAIISMGRGIFVEQDETIISEYPSGINFSTNKTARLLNCILGRPVPHNLCFFGLYSIDYLKSSKGFIALKELSLNEIYFLFMVLQDGNIAYNNLTKFYYRRGGSSWKPREPLSAKKFINYLLIAPLSQLNSLFKFITLPSSFYVRILLLISMPFLMIYKIFSHYILLVNHNLKKLNVI